MCSECEYPGQLAQQEPDEYETEVPLRVDRQKMNDAYLSSREKIGYQPGELALVDLGRLG